MRLSLRVLALVAIVAGCAADEQVSEVQQEAISGALAPRFDNTLLGGGVVVEGASLAGREDLVANTTATIPIAGIPAGSTVSRALLYWIVSGGTDTSATVNGTPVTGTSLGTGGQTCWSADNTAYRADVTSLVTGNGSYVIGGLPSSTTLPGVDTDGAALVVTYSNASSGIRRRVLIRDGIITTDGQNDTVSDTFTALAAVAAPLAGTARFHLVVGDGQNDAGGTPGIAEDGALRFNGTTIATNQFGGSDGSLWDARSYDVTVPGGLATVTWTSENFLDCLSYSTAVFDFTVGVCGDIFLSGGEQCEQRNTINGDGCSAQCTIEPGWNCTGSPSVCTTTCGDGIRVGAEACDDGDTMGGDGCSATCTIEPGWTCSGSPASTCTTLCGDGIRAGAEACDDGDSTGGDGCSATCTVESGWMCSGAPLSTCTTLCGDGIRAGAETCDDGDTMAGDGCSATCSVENGWTCSGAPLSTCVTTCGDGIPAGAETCDDGGTTSGDGCSATCVVEPGWMCSGEPSTCGTTCGDGIIAGTETCDQGSGNVTGGDGCSATCMVETGWTCVGAPSTCTTTCGDGIVAGTEACDDDDTDAGDGCSATCTVETGWTCAGMPSVCAATCGDGIISGSEACDDNGTTAGDGCSPTCTVETGWTCTGMPSACAESCGDGRIVGDEACDDGDTSAGDGCSATCAIEPGFTCTGEPSMCAAVCGDGMKLGTEACDDGNTTADDGCSPTCTVENGWTCTGTECTEICGDGLVIASEICDDGNTVPGDGCSDSCQVEDNWRCTGDGPSTCEQLTVAGGGCSTSGGSSSLLLAGVLGALLLGRRRRRASALLATCGALVVLAVPAQAQSVSGDAAFSAERFRLAMDRDGVLGTESPRTTGHLVIDVGLWLGYANDPITVRVGSDHDRAGALVADRFGGDLVASFGLTERFELGFAAPVILSQDESLGTLMTNGSLSSAGLGDITVTPKLSLLRGPVDLGILAAVTLPTSGGDNFFGEDSVTFAPALLVGGFAGPARIFANLGYRLREQTQMATLEVDDEMFARLGLGIRAGVADIMLEAALATPASSPLDEFNANYAEVRGGLGVDLSSKIRAFAAAGVGLANGYGTPDWRGLVGLWIGTGKPTQEAPVVVTTPTPVPDTSDPDGDGIVGAADTCPTEPETLNNYQDDDGCPDALPDTDKDGIVDSIDKCPEQAEDKDAFEDDDGCPEDDNDQDRIVDGADKCPLVPGVVEMDGCPDPDRDGDTVVDRLDNCPDEPGTVKNNGCKDKQLVVFTGDSIKLLDVVYFDTNKATLQKRSNALLENVAKVINAHPEITKVTVEGHTDDRGNDAKNKDLSQRRAQSVVAFLVSMQVKAELLTPIGFGEDQPIQSNKTAKGRAANRRVEFKVESGAPKQ